MKNKNGYSLKQNKKVHNLHISFITQKPLREKYYAWSPYTYCKNNPINRIDPNGMDDFVYNGTVIGNNGVDNGAVYALKTTESSFGNAEDGSLVEGAGLSKAELKATITFIKTNSGNTDAFQENGIAYTNSIAIESSADVRQAMVDEISRDNGKGGKSAANNREYGGSISNGIVSLVEPGPVSSSGNNASIALPTGMSTFHSHPSGTITTSPKNNTLGNSPSVSSYYQHPSSRDIQNAGSYTHYVFGRNKGNSSNVYIYNSSGVQAVIPLKYFVNPKR